MLNSYKEILLTAPNGDGLNFSALHWRCKADETLIVQIFSIPGGPHTSLKRLCHEIFDLWRFHQTIPTRLLIHDVNIFEFRIEFA
jgi:hypothetical protein